MRFTKMQGAGNDFIVVNNMDGKIEPETYGDLARRFCPRRMSIGADGFMIVEPARRGGDFRMAFYNSDGSMGEMCGNGARCIAKYGYEKGIAGEEMVIETTAGEVQAWRLSEREYKVRLNDITVLEKKSLEALGETWDCAYVELGNPGIPHLVLAYPMLKDTSAESLWALGKALRSHGDLSKGANVNFYEITDTDRVFERTFERGVEDFTYACGTGTGSVVGVLAGEGLVTGRHTAVDMEGGTLFIDVEREGENITGLYLSGPAVIVAEGETGEV